MATLGGTSNANEIVAKILNGKTVIESLGKLVTLVGFMSSGNVYFTAKKVGSSSGYQVPAGKKFILFGFRIFSGAGNGEYDLQESSNDVGFASSTAPTSTGSPQVYPHFITSTGDVMVEHVLEITAGNYLSGQANIAAEVHSIFYGFEMNADDTLI